MSPGIDTSLVRRVLHGDAEFHEHAAEHYAALAGSGGLTWVSDVEAWICTEHGLASTVLTDTHRYETTPPRDTERPVPTEVARLRATWLEFADGVRHRRARADVANAISDSLSAVRWSGFVGSFGALVDGLPNSADPVDLVELLAEPLWSLLLREWVGLDDAMASRIDGGLPSVSSVAVGGTEAEHLEAATDAMSTLTEAVQAARRSDRPVVGLLGTMVRACPERTAGQVAAHLLNLLADASPLPDALLLCLNTLLRDPVAFDHAVSAAARAGNGSASDAVGTAELRETVVELLRRDPVQVWVLRFAGETHELAGREIDRDDRIIVVIGAVNRDQRVYPEPESFRPGLHAAGLSFGLGPHSCLGRRVAMEVITHLLGRLLRSRPLIATAAPIQWVAGIGLRTPARFPVHLGGPA